jgi:hypothetical protein
MNVLIVTGKDLVLFKTGMVEEELMIKGVGMELGEVQVGQEQGQ